MMKLGETLTGAIVNGSRLLLAFLGALCILLALSSAIYVLSGGPSALAGNERWYIPIGAFVAGVVIFRAVKSFSINSNTFLIPDVLREAQKKDYAIDDIDRIVRTLEAHTGSAAFFNRIGFTGLSLGTIAAAFLVLTFGYLGLWTAWIEIKQFDAFMDLAKLLFGAFVGSFANKLVVAPEAKPKTPPKPDEKAVPPAVHGAVVPAPST
ncbi:MAG: hypothetical protein H7274_01825 [Rhodoferax sp.]|nr:hypothetical protein [Rhodoferax sp.]